MTESESSIRSRWLVGADGARSPVRKACDIAFEDLGFEEPWLVVDVLVKPGYSPSMAQGMTRTQEG
mgnify:CR=1 FL=1